MTDSIYRGFIKDMENTVPSIFPRFKKIAVVDECQFGRLGLQSLFTMPILSMEDMSVSIHDQVEGTMTKAHGGTMSTDMQCCLILRLSIHPAQALQQLLCLERKLMARSGFQRLIVISPFKINSIIRQALICGGVQVPIRIVSARSPLLCLFRIVLFQEAFMQDGSDERLPQKSALILSASERRVLSKNLIGISIIQQAKLLNLSDKTLYSQRSNALRKLKSSGISDLLLRFY